MDRADFILKAQEQGWVLFSATREVLSFHCTHPGCEHTIVCFSSQIDAGKVPKPCDWPHDNGRSRYHVTSYDEIVYQLRRARWRYGLSQADLGSVIGLTDGHINKLETGDRLATWPILVPWIQSLGFDVILVPSGLPPQTVRAIQSRVYQPTLTQARPVPRRRRVRGGRG